jgi:predicted dehydrogenase
MGKVRVAVVGVGYLGQFHAEKYAKIEEAELVGVVDIDVSRARKIAKRYRTQPFFHHSDLFNKVQAVSVAVPTYLHHSITKDLFLQGIDVLLEKPIASTLEETDELIGLAKSKGLVLQVGHLERFNGALIASEKMVQNPVFIESHRLGPFSGRGIDVSIVLDLMIHDIDILLNLLNSKVKQIHAIGLPILTPCVDIANAWIEFENGCVANLTASRVSKEKTRRTRIFQSNGTLTIDYLTQKASFTKKTAPSKRKEIPEMVTEEIPVIKVDPLETEIRSFLESVKERSNVQVSGRDGKRALEVAFQIIEKIGRGPEKKEWGGVHPPTRSRASFFGCGRGTSGKEGDEDPLSRLFPFRRGINRGPSQTSAHSESLAGIEKVLRSGEAGSDHLDRLS